MFYYSKYISFIVMFFLMWPIAEKIPLFYRLANRYGMGAATHNPS